MLLSTSKQEVSHSPVIRWRALAAAGRRRTKRNQNKHGERSRIMMKSTLTIGLALAALLSGPAAAVSPSLSDPATQARLDSSFQYDFTSKVSGKKYTVRVFFPEGAPRPPVGYPVLYVLDGDALFGPFAMAMAVRGGVGEIRPAVVVGISGADEADGAHRTYDYSSTSLTAEELGIIKDFGPGAKLGGAADFNRILNEEIRPRIDATFGVDEKESSLLGWSLAGHYVIYTLLEHPETFKNFVALSPSLWLGGRHLFQDIPAFEKKIAAGAGDPNLMISVGSLEANIKTDGFAGKISAADFAKEVSYTSMARNEDELATQLRPIFQRNGMVLTSRLFEGDSHNSEPFSAVNSVLDFIYGKRR